VAIQKEGLPPCGGPLLRPEFYDFGLEFLNPPLQRFPMILPELHDYSEAPCVVCPGGEVVLRIVVAGPDNGARGQPGLCSNGGLHMARSGAQRPLATVVIGA
jgi:hypothetical protein